MSKNISTFIRTNILQILEMQEYFTVRFFQIIFLLSERYMYVSCIMFISSFIAQHYAPLYVH